MKLIADIAKSNNIKVLFIMQPTLYEAKEFKNLVNQEIREYIHTQTGYFALKNEDVKELNSVPSEIVLSRYYWDFDDYLLNYRKLRKNLKLLCFELRIDCINMNSAISRNKNESIFTSPYHYTYTGAKIFGNEIKDRLSNSDYFSLDHNK